MRVCAVDLDAALHDLRGRKAIFPLVYRGDSYAAARDLLARADTPPRTAPPSTARVVLDDLCPRSVAAVSDISWRGRRGRCCAAGGERDRALDGRRRLRIIASIPRWPEPASALPSAQVGHVDRTRIGIPFAFSAPGTHNARLRFAAKVGRCRCRASVASVVVVPVRARLWPWSAACRWRTPKTPRPPTLARR